MPFLLGRKRLIIFTALVLMQALFISTLSNGWGKMPRHNHQHLPQVFGCCCPLESITPLILFLPFQTTMSNFALPSVDISLWEPMMKVRWDSHNFCPVVKNVQVWVIMQAQLNTLSQAGVWGDVGKHWWDMAFLLIVPNITSWYKRVFGLVAVWAHPYQAHYHNLEVAAHKLALLVDESADWAYAFVWLNEALSHAPLLSEGHISAMMDGVPSADACGWLYQLQICKLLQHKDMVVCSESLNGELEALQFTFQELPLWDAAAPGKPAYEPQLIEVNLSSMQPESMTTTIQTPTSTLVLPPLWLIPLILPVTSLQPSTCSSRGPWSGCSGLPAQPQPLSPSTVCQEESCHW